MQEPVLRIYWPCNVHVIAGGGLIYGWVSPHASGGVTCVVAGVARFDLSDDLRVLKKSLATLDAISSWRSAASLKVSCSTLPKIIGEWVDDDVRNVITESRRINASRWLVMRSSQEFRHLPEIVSWCSSDLICTALPAHVVVLFRPPDVLSLQYFSSRPCRTSPLHALGAKAMLLPRLTAIMPHVARPPFTPFDSTLNQINAVAFVVQCLRNESTSEFDSRPSVRSVFRTRILNTLLWPPLAALLCFRIIAWMVLCFLSTPVFPGGQTLYACSSLAQQVHLKLCEFCMWPTLLHDLQRKRREVKDGKLV
jgi:hypothetical protein